MFIRVKKRCLLIVATILCVCMLGAFPVARASAASGYSLLTKVKTAKAGSFVKDAGGWKYICKDGSFPRKSWKKIKSNIFYFDKNGYMQTGWRKYKDSWYYLCTGGKKKGMLVTGWKTIGGKRYYFSRQTGARVTGWQTIGKFLYYFNRKGVLQKGKTVGEYTLDASTGRAVKTSELVNEVDAVEKSSILTSAALAGDNRSVHIFIGDSRTVGLCSAIGAGYHDGELVEWDAGDGKEYYLARVSSGYSWYSTTALPQLKKLLKKNPTASVVLNHGVNDLDNADRYISSYRSLMPAYPKAKFIVMSVNPVNTKLYKGYAQPEVIEKFNDKLLAAFPQNFVDTYHYLQENKFKSPDGLHYDSLTYEKIYNYVKYYL